MWNLINSKSQKQLNGVCQGLGSGGNEETMVKRYKLLIIREISSGGTAYSLVTIVNNAVLYT